MAQQHTHLHKCNLNILLESNTDLRGVMFFSNLGISYSLIINLQGDSEAKYPCCSLDMALQQKAHYRIYYCYKIFKDLENIRPHSCSKTMNISKNSFHKA